MARPIGDRIIEACNIVEERGTANYREVYEHMEGVALANAGKYCQRAVGLGFMTVDREVYPKRYSVVPDWREQIKAAKPAPVPAIEGCSKGESIVRRAIRTQPSSVFSLGGFSA